MIKILTMHPCMNFVRGGVEAFWINALSSYGLEIISGRRIIHFFMKGMEYI